MPVQIFWVSPKIWLHLVPLQKLSYRHKKQVYWMQIIFFVLHKMFVTGTICIFIWSSTKHFGTCKRTRINILPCSKNTKLIRSLFWHYLNLLQDHKDFLPILLFLVSMWVVCLRLKRSQRCSCLSFWGILLTVKTWIYKSGNALEVTNALSQFCLGQADDHNK